MRTLHPDVNQPPYNAHELNGHVLTNISQDNELEELLTRAEQIDGGWVILVFHRASADAPSDAYVKPDQFQGFVDLVAKHGAKVETIGEHLGYFKCAELPAQPTLVVGDKSLDPPAEVTPVDHTDTGTDSNPPAGCQAGTRQPWPWPLLLAFAWVAARRKRAS